MRYSINQFKELFNDEEFNQLWSKYELDDDTYDVDDAYIGKRRHKQKLNKLKLQKTKDKRYRLSTLVKMFNTHDRRMLSKHYFDYTTDGHHIKMYTKSLRDYLDTDEERLAYDELVKRAKEGGNYDV